MRIALTFTANIYVGLLDRETGVVGSVDSLRSVCQEYVNQVGLCVSFTQTEFIYTNGAEPGVIVGLINYPRFPSEPLAIKDHALELARRMMESAKQQRVSIVLPHETIMLTNPLHQIIMKTTSAEEK